MRSQPRSLQIRKALAYGARRNFQAAPGAAPAPAKVPYGHSTAHAVKKAERHLRNETNAARHELNRKLRARVRAVMPLVKKLMAGGMNRPDAIRTALAQTPATGMSGCEIGGCTCC